MATHVALHAKKRLSAEVSTPSCEDLIRLLVRQLMPSNTSGERQGNPDHQEEVLLDMDLDGAHYLFIRLPLERSQRVQLSPREQEIVRMVAHGHSNKIIADVLSISSWTVCTHLRRIFAKLGVGSRAAMVARTLEENRLWTQASSKNKTMATMAGSNGPSPPPAADIHPSKKAAACGPLMPRRAS
jgi:DNA-binding CsgD family transcriptional regulator